MAQVEGEGFMTWFLFSRGTEHLQHLLKLVGFMDAQYLWKLGHICLVCSADGEAAMEIYFFTWKSIYCLFWGSCQLLYVLFLSLPIFPQDPEQGGTGRVYSVSLRVATDFSCPLVSWQVVLHSPSARVRQGLPWQDPPFTPALLPPSRDMVFAVHMPW